MRIRLSTLLLVFLVLLSSVSIPFLAFCPIRGFQIEWTDRLHPGMLVFWLFLAAGVLLPALRTYRRPGSLRGCESFDFGC